MTTNRRQLLAGAGLLAASLNGMQGANASASVSRPKGGTVMMEAWEIGAQSGIESLRHVQRAAPVPGPGEALIGVRAAALNHRDLAIVAARYGKPKPASRIPLGDGAGEVLAIGPQVTSVKVGDRVTAPHFMLWIDGDYSPSVFDGDVGNAIDGWLARRIVLPAAALVPLPQGMSYEDAAALGAAGITAWAVIHSFGRVRSGETVLALGTGGVSILALQIAKLAGARFAITSSSDAKLERVRGLGADITVNYHTHARWQDAILEATDGRGVDIVVETVGFSTLPQSLACCAPNARIGLLGALGARPEGPQDLGPLIRSNVVVKGITSGSRRMLEDLLRAFASNRVQPVIDRRFGFADAVAAFRYLESAEHIGKVVIAGIGESS